MSSLDPSVLFAALPFSLWQWLLVELAIVLAYVVFGIAGFGTALVAGPLLAGVLPLSQIIPLLVLLDFSASFGNWLPARRRSPSLSSSVCCPACCWAVRSGRTDFWRYARSC